MSIGLAPVQILMIGVDDLGVLNGFLGFESDLEEMEQVVGDAIARNLLLR